MADKTINIPINNPFQFKSDTYKVYHITDRDCNCDIHLLVSKNDGKDEILIPTDKQILVDNFKYFERMFDSSSNWEEAKICESSSKSAQMIKINLPNTSVFEPTILAEYLKSLYTGKLSLSPRNCIEYHQIIDFLIHKNEEHVREITEYARSNINCENIVLAENVPFFYKAALEYWKKCAANTEEINLVIRCHDGSSFNYKIHQIHSTDKFISYYKNLYGSKFKFIYEKPCGKSKNITECYNMTPCNFGMRYDALITVYKK